MTADKIIMYGTARLAQKLAIILSTFLVFSVSGCGIFGGGDDDYKARVEAAEEVYQIGVNAYLWRATLDTLSFMPISNADQKSGVILTDWKINPSNDKERTKVDVFILGRKLTADSVKITVHRQLKSGTSWLDETPRPGASINIRNAVLMQARLLRRNNAPVR